MESLTTKELEEYLFKVVEATLRWAGVTDYTKEDVADLVMLELLNIKRK